MSDDNEQSKETNQKPQLTFGKSPSAFPEGQNELQLLKERAKTMGISHSPNIGVEALKEKINAKMENRASKEDEDEDKNEDEENDEEEIPEYETESAKRRSARMKARSAAKKAVSKKETTQQIRDRLQKEAMRLVRCRIYNMNPSKADLKGEIVTVANKYIGTVRKMIPFGEGTDSGYHIPHILLKELQSRKFQQLRPKKIRGIEQAPERRMVPEYNIEILPNLTRKELRELAEKQAAAERLGSSE